MRNANSIADLRCCLAALVALFAATASAAASTPEAWEDLFAEAGAQSPAACSTRQPARSQSISAMPFCC